MGTSFLGLILTEVLNMYLSFILAISLLGIDCREIIFKSEKNTLTRMFIQVLFIKKKKTTVKTTYTSKDRRLTNYRACILLNTRQSLKMSM